ncbi:MAG: CDP-alcohol phosphatidyltransferase family protein [Steroidobacteraceae bacterium]
MSLRWLPNGLCVLRMLLTLPIAWLLVRSEFVWTLVLFFFAAVTDAADGYLAKRFHWESELGKMIDPLADKLLLITVFITLAWIQLVPVWLAALVVLRDVLITGGALTYRCLYGRIVGAAPTLLSKLNTLVQILFVCAVIATAALHKFGFNWPPMWLVDAAAWGVVLTTVSSGADYVWTYSHRAVQMRHQLRNRGD